MEEFDIREATPEDAEKIIAYLAQVGGETDYLSFGKEGLPISTEEEEKFIQNINKEEHSVLNWNPSFQFASLSSDLANRLHK